MRLSQRLITTLSAGLLITLVALTVISLRYTNRDYAGNLMVHDIALLAETFAKIHQDAQILSFDNEHNRINFLNVGTFAGSEVGPMNLGNSAGWQGPYLENNPQIQDIEYEVVKTEQGYFIIPGNGVTLPNGQVMGRDLIVNVDADMQHLMHEQLSYRGQPLAAHIDLTDKARKADPGAVKALLTDE